MPISVTCTCGHQFRVKDKYAGQQGYCPQCRAVVLVPGVPQAAPASGIASPSNGPGTVRPVAAATVTTAPASNAAAPVSTAPAATSMHVEQLRIARSIHQGLLPKQAPEVAMFEIAGMSRAGTAIGGDYFDYLPFQDGSLGVVIGDASGHGLGAALLMAEARMCLRALAQCSSDVGNVFTLANRVFSGALPDDYYVTLTLSRLDLTHRLLTYASAGHPTGYVLDANGQVKWNLESTDCPLGLMPQTRYGSSNPLRLEPGEVALFVTNGILKVKSPAGQPFGVQQLLATVATLVRQPAQTIVDNLYQTIVRYAQGSLADDVTAVVIKAR